MAYGAHFVVLSGKLWDVMFAVFMRPPKKHTWYKIGRGAGVQVVDGTSLRSGTQVPTNFLAINFRLCAQ